MSSLRNPRDVVVRCLRQDLGKVTEDHVRAAVLCGEMGCHEMREFIESHPVLRCPYAGQPDGQEKCQRLREEYLAACHADTSAADRRDDKPVAEYERHKPERDQAPSMHEGVETWCDVCSCEPEPRWQALAEELEREAKAG